MIENSFLIKKIILYILYYIKFLKRSITKFIENISYLFLKINKS